MISAAIAAGAVIVVALLIWSAKPAAPQVTFVSLKGEKITTADLRGKVVLVNFWATDCAVCVKEMPHLVSTYRKYRAQGFETIAVAMKYDPPNYVLNYVEKTALPFTVTLDPMGELARAFGDVRLTPTTFVIDRQGRIVTRILGEPDFAALHALLEEKLRES
ncbi:MAG: TlpA family protein disulfide reductase [Betaproteobacteria bacterium]|nr:TlpA family protein disulfide reductase [Betaproteobacteria bacterium]MDH4292483.1 TlpA family protein disulfide reductase [Betaproteobacteria bacterium]